MSGFQLAETAFRDINSILAYFVDEGSIDYAYSLRRELFETFARLAQTPGIGHPRPDLTRRPYVFFLVEPYLIAYDRTRLPLTIHAVLHSKRDIRSILRSRSR